MPTSTVVRGSIFAAGLLVGIGAGGAIFAKRDRRQSAGGAAPDIRPVTSGAIVDVHTPRNQVVLAGTRVTDVSNQILRYGFPGPTPDILKRTAYVAAYDRRMRHPAWTAEHLTLASLGKSPVAPSTSPRPLPGAGALPTGPALIAQPPGSVTVDPGKPGKGDRGKSQFSEDQDVPALFRAQLKDYFRSGYDRGHMVPAADAKISQQAMDETFLLTNIAPQIGEGFNRHYWAYVEDFCRRLTGSFEDVYVFTIPLYLPAQQSDGKWRVSYEVIGSPPSISVPTHFAKVILTSRSPAGRSVTDAARDMSIGAFVLPNAVIPDEAPLTQFAVPGTVDSFSAFPPAGIADSSTYPPSTVEAVERAAGLTLFSPAVKGGAKQLCRETRCDVVVRRFDDARKGQGQGNGKGGKK